MSSLYLANCTQATTGKIVCTEHIYYAIVYLKELKTKTNSKMFRKVVSNLAFSPALVGQLGFYARRLKKEEATRRLGLVFTALALVVQSLTVFTPPESANAANGSDMIYGGVNSKQAILAEYDKYRSDFKDIMSYAGITRAELANMTSGTINSRGQGTGANAWQTWGRNHVFSAAQGEVKHSVPLDTGGASTLYSKPLWLYDSTSYTIKNGSSYPAFIGHSAARGKFAIAKDCGNLITTSTPKPHVGAHFIAASCEMIRGKAVDSRDKNARITVYLYFGGPPGSGKKSEAIMTAASDNTFSFKVPETYKKSADPTKVWGVMLPLAGWGDSTVQFDNTVTIPGGCIKAEPSAQCKQLSFNRISRTDFKLVGKATAKNGAKIKTYRFSVVNAAGNTVLSKDVASSADQASTERLSITEPGSYTAKLTVLTSDGKKTSENCNDAFKINAAGVPGVDINKTVDGNEPTIVNVNGEFAYQLKVTNSGDIALKLVDVIDKAPNGVTLLGANLGNIANNSWSYRIPSLGVNESITISLKAKVTSFIEGQIINTACVNAPEVNPSQPTVTDDCDDSPITVSPPLAVIEVCDLATKTFVTIKESEFNASKHSKNREDCKQPCQVGVPNCEHITEAKTGKNLTQGVDASTIKAQASDRIEYTVYLENIGQTTVSRTISEELTDVMEYATLLQSGGGTYDETTKVLSWGDISLKPGEKTSRSFVVQLLSTIPTTARGASEPSSYDCIMTNAFGNTVAVPVACETPKLVEGAVAELPKTGPGENMLFAGIAGTVVTFFWARSRQLAREVRLVRKDFNMGTI